LGESARSPGSAGSLPRDIGVTPKELRAANFPTRSLWRALYANTVALAEVNEKASPRQTVTERLRESLELVQRLLYPLEMATEEAQLQGLDEPSLREAFARVLTNYPQRSRERGNRGSSLRELWKASAALDAIFMGVAYLWVQNWGQNDRAR
jgi:hypothetical protein